MSEQHQPPPAPGRSGSPESVVDPSAVDIAVGVRIQAVSFSATVWGTVVRLVPVLAVALLCLLAFMLPLMLLAAPSGMVAAVPEGRLRVAPTGMWSATMWWSMAALMLVAVLFLTWALGYATAVAGAVAVGRQIGSGTAALLAVRAVRRLVWPVGISAALVASSTVVPWLLAAGVAVALVWLLPPLWPLAVFTRSPGPRNGEAVEVSRGQRLGAAVAMSLLALTSWWWNDPAPSEHLEVAAGFVWAAGWAALIAVTGAVLVWGLVRHLGQPTATAASCQVATWLAEVTAPRPAAPGRRAAVAAVSVAVALGLAIGLALTPVSTRAVDPAGRAPSWTAMLRGWNPMAGQDGLSAAVAGDLVVVTVNQAGPPGVVVYDRRGAPQWVYRYQGEQPFSLRFWLTGDAVVLYGRLHEEFRVLDLRTGRLRFSVRTRPNVVGMVTERTLVVAGRLSEWHCEHPRAFDLRTGRMRWERTDRCLLGLQKLSRERVWIASPWLGLTRPAPATDASVVWARITPDSVVGRPRYGTVLDIETGEEVVAPYRVPTEVYQGRIVSDALYLDLSDPRWSGRCEDRRQAPGHSATLRARDPWTGEMRWTAEVAQWRTGGPSCHPGVPQLTPEGLLARTPRGGLRLFDLRTGQPRWTVEDAAEPVALVGRTVILRSSRTGYDGTANVGIAMEYVALDTRTGERLWAARCIDSARVTPRRFVCRRAEPVGDGYAAERVWVSDLRSGELRWATRGVPLWAGNVDARPVQAGDEWLMTYRLEHDESGRFHLRLQMYDRPRNG